MIQEASGEREFLGDEFLTWLWYKSETEGGTFSLPAFGSVGVAFDRYMEFRDERTGGRLSIRSDAVTRTVEAHAALATGKKVGKARLIIGVQEDNLEVTLDGATLDLGALRLPPSETDDPLERLLEQTYRLTATAQIIGELYDVFLLERLSPKFEAEILPHMQKWVASRGPSVSPDANPEAPVATERPSPSPQPEVSRV